MVLILIRSTLLLVFFAAFAQVRATDIVRKRVGNSKPAVQTTKMSRADSSAFIEKLWNEKNWPEVKAQLAKGFNPNLPVFDHKHLLVKALQQNNMDMCEFLLQIPALNFQTMVEVVRSEKREGIWIREVRSYTTLIKYVEEDCLNWFYNEGMPMIHYHLIKRGQITSNVPNLAKILFEYYARGFPANISFENIPTTSPLFYKIKILDTLIRMQYTLSETYSADSDKMLPVQIAAQQSDTLMVQRLLDAGASIESVKVHDLLQKKVSAKTFAYFVRKGISSYEDYDNYYLSGSTFDSYSITPLQYCIWENQDTEWISILLAHSTKLDRPALLKGLMTTRKEFTLKKWMKLHHLQSKNEEAYARIVKALKSKT